MKLFWKIFFIFLIIFTVIGIGFSITIKNTLKEIQNPNIIVAEIDNAKTDNDNTSKGPINILIAGIADYSLADSIILCSFYPEKKYLNLMSIPRDTFYHRKGFNRADLKKINASHAVKGGSDIKAKSLIDSVSDLLGVEIHDFIKLDFEAVEKSIDAIGGVKIDIEDDMYYFDSEYSIPLLINFKKGTQKLNGEESLKYLRYREKSKGDLGRIERQQKFIKSFITQSLNLKIFKVLEIATEHVETTMSTKDITNYLGQLYKMKNENISFTVLPGEPEYIDGVSYYIHNKIETQKLISNIYKISEGKTR